MARIFFGRNAIKRAKARLSLTKRYGKKSTEAGTDATIRSAIRIMGMSVKSDEHDSTRIAKGKRGNGPFKYRGVTITPDSSLSKKRREEIRAAMLHAASHAHEPG